MKKLVIVGAGGFGREVAQYIKDINKIENKYELLGFVDDVENKKGKSYEGVIVLGKIEDIKKIEDIYFTCPIGNPQIKEKLVKRALNHNLKPESIVHPTSCVGDTTKIGEGVIIAPNCTITVNVDLKDFVSLNPNCGIGHDTKIGKYSTLYWNVNIGGFVEIGESVEMGTGSFVKQNLKIIKNTLIGAGAVVTKDIKKASTYIGAPAKEMSGEENV